MNRGKEAGLDVFRGGPLGIHCYMRNKTCSQGAGRQGVERGVMPPWKRRDTSEEVDETASGVKMARQNL